MVRACVRGVTGLLALMAVLAGSPAPAHGQDRLCDPANENCRTILIDLIRNEKVGIDVAFWFMEDQRYTTELIARHKAGVPVRVLVDTRANDSSQWNADRLKELRDAGIPMRRRTASGILHWKMMLFSGQGRVQFSGANYSANAWVYSGSPYTNYTDEVIYFTDDSKVVNSFRTKFDDLWINTSTFGNYANINSALVRSHAIFPKDPELNFPPNESFASRSVSRYNAETQRIDAIIYRITDRRHTDALIAARGRGVTVRIITEQNQYRDVNRLWHAWNVDRLYLAGVQIRHREHAGLNHQKSTILHSQKMSIIGSSNWTGPSDNSQEEHNYFTTKPYFYSWLTDQFNRKWTNSASVAETRPFTPLPPDKPGKPSPAHFANSVSPSSVTLSWYGGPWAHLYDVYLGTDPNNMALLAENVELGPSLNTSQNQSFKVPTSLASGTTYYWRVVAKTMALVTRASDTWTFTTAGTASPPPPSGSPGPDDIVLYAADASATAGRWAVVNDGTAAAGRRMHNANQNDPKVGSAAASPANYFELTFQAVAGKPYRLWLRARADSNNWANDSVFVQFSGSVNASGSSIWRIGTTSATEVNLEDCSGCGLSGWGWQDNGWGTGVMGPVVYFSATGTQRIRIQQREDGISIDQVVLSPSTFLNTSPGALKNDATVLPKQGGSTSTSPPPPSTTSDDVVLYAALAGTVKGSWVDVADTSAAGGVRLRNPDAGVAKLSTAAASPANYFELTFNAQAGKAYRLWIRARADGNHWANDSVFVQFSGSVNASGSAIYRIGTTNAAEVNLEDCNGCGLSGWGWQDNGWGAGVMGPLIYFSTTGPHTIRVQQREDGISIDQIVLSPSTYLNKAPGALKNDSTILQKTQ